MLTQSDLLSMSVSDLEKLSADVAIAILDVKKNNRSEALIAANEVAKSFGLTLNELVSGITDAPKSKRVYAAKYAHPDDDTKTWTGMGRKPNFINELVASGVDLESLRIK